MKKTTIIIPVHEFKEEIVKFFDKCVESIESQKHSTKTEVLIVHSADIDIKFFEYLKTKKFKYKLISNEGNTSFQSQINLAVKSIKTEFFSILEFDDTIADTYLSNVDKYINHIDYSDVDVFLNILIEADVDNRPSKMTNEVVWSKQFVGENGTMGYLNADVLKQYTDFKICGGIFNTAKFIEFGGLKTNIDITFQLELLLRLLNNGCKIFVLPKVIYKHIINRENSLFDVYGKTTTNEDRSFWFEKAMSEFYFTNDRLIERTSPKLKIIENEANTIE